MNTLSMLLVVAGILHLMLLSASFLTPKVLHWRTELQNVSALSRHIIWVHGAFIVIVILGFALVSLLNAQTLSGGTPLARSVCGFIALFWLGRLVIQFAVFDARPYLTKAVLKMGYHSMTVLFAFFAAVYGWAALWPQN